MIKPLEITFYIEPDKLEGFVMDIRDASMNPKDKNDWHRLLADSAEDQAERQNRECECTDCSCGKEEMKLKRLSDLPPCPSQIIYATSNPETLGKMDFDFSRETHIINPPLFKGNTQSIS